MAILRPPVRRHRNDFSIHLTADQSELLLRLLDEMVEMLNTVDQKEPLDPTLAENRQRLARLFPPAYSGADTDPDLAEREEEYQRLMREELVQSRLASISTVREALTNPRHLSEPQLIAFMQSINALRLVLGTILQITDDGDDPIDGVAAHQHDDPALDPDDPNIGLQMAYDFLSWLLEWTVQALSG